MQHILVIRLEPKDKCKTGEDLFSYLNNNRLADFAPGAVAIDRNLKFEFTEVREDDPAPTVEIEPQTIELILNNVFDLAPAGSNPGGSLFQHNDVRDNGSININPADYNTLLGDTVPAATLCVTVPQHTDVDGNNVNSFEGTTFITDDFRELRLKISRFENGDWVGFHQQSVQYAKLFVNGTGVVFEGNFLNLGLGPLGVTIDPSGIPITEAEASSLSTALYSDYTASFAADAPSPLIEILDPVLAADLQSLGNGESIGFGSMAGLIREFEGLGPDDALDENIDIEALTESMVAGMISSGMPFPGFPDGLNITKPSLPSLPTNPAKLLEKALGAVDKVAMAAGATASIPQITEKIKRDVKEAIATEIVKAKITQSDQIRIKFPVRPDLLGKTGEDTPIKEVEVIVCSDSFKPGSLLDAITSEHIFALTANSPEEFSEEDRLEQIMLMDATQIRKQLDKAIADGKLADSSEAEKGKIVRQLGALVANDGNTPKCSIEKNSPAHDLLKDWASYNTAPEISKFWEVDVSSSSSLKEGHLDLLLCFLLKGHETLIGEVKATLASLEVSELVKTTCTEWQAFFYPCLPDFTAPGSIEERMNRFLRRAARVTAGAQTSTTADEIVTQLTDWETTDAQHPIFEAALGTTMGGAVNAAGLRAMTDPRWRNFLLFDKVNTASLPPQVNPDALEERFSLFIQRFDEIRSQSPLATFPQILDDLTEDEVTGSPHTPLNTAITDPVPTGLGVGNSAALAAVTEDQWRDLFFPGPRLDLFPAFTTYTTFEQRLCAFYKRFQEIKKDSTITTIGGFINELTYGSPDPTLVTAITAAASTLAELKCLNKIRWDTILEPIYIPATGAPFPDYTDVVCEANLALFMERFEQVKNGSIYADIVNELAKDNDGQNTALIAQINADATVNTLASIQAADEATWRTFFKATPNPFPEYAQSVSPEDRCFAFIERIESVIADINDLSTGFFTGSLPTYAQVLQALTSTDGSITGTPAPALVTEINNLFLPGPVPASGATIPMGPPATSSNPIGFDTIAYNAWKTVFFPLPRLELFPPFARSAGFDNDVAELIRDIEKCIPVPCPPAPTPESQIPLPPTFDCLVDDCLTPFSAAYKALSFSPQFAATSAAITGGTITTYAAALDSLLQDPADPIRASIEAWIDQRITDASGTPDEPSRFAEFGIIAETDWLDWFAATNQCPLYTQAFNGSLDPTIRDAALATLADCPECLPDVIETIGNLVQLTTLPTPASLPMQFSLMEALYARGFTAAADITTLSQADFKAALMGTVAYQHADAIWNIANSLVPHTPPGTGSGDGFVPINPDGSLRNCLPQPHLSACSPVIYLQELLALKEDSTCANPAGNTGMTLDTAITNRRGDLKTLEVSQNNLEVPIPLIDLVNESLEDMVYENYQGNPAKGYIYNTSEAGLKEGLDKAQYRCAIPEYSAPAFPTDPGRRTLQRAAYDRLRNDVASPCLPYDPLVDIRKCYLDYLFQTAPPSLGNSLFDLQRRFTEEIHEYALKDLPTDSNPTNFKTHLWRLPVTIDLAIAYLCIEKQEYIRIFDGLGGASNKELYGIPAADPLVSTISRLPEFLKRMGLSYDDFRALVAAEFVLFSNPANFPAAEPKDISGLMVNFTPNTGDGNEAGTPTEKFRRLAIFIRLWRKLCELPTANYSFAELRQITNVLEMYKSGMPPQQNPDFIRQLAAFQMLRDYFGLELAHTLHIWDTTASAEARTSALQHLLDRIEAYAEQKHHCQLRPDLKKVLLDNLDKLSVLAGFDPDDVDQTWFAHPTHTIRFAEVLAKIYASDFDVNELCYICSNEHLSGEDPFMLQSEIEAERAVFELPVASESTLAELRDQLLAVAQEITEKEEWKNWTWKTIKQKLVDDFCFDESNSKVTLEDFKNHFFAGIDDANGYAPPTNVADAHYCVTLNNSNAEQWNQPLNNPFEYNVNNTELCFTLPLVNEHVMQAIYTDKLNQGEKEAVRDLYYAPRMELAQFGFLFPDLLATSEYLIQEPDTEKRWQYFQKAFAVFYRRCEVMTAFLVEHIANSDCTSDFKDGKTAMWTILKNLRADENNAVSGDTWEDSTGAPPSVLWEPLPHAGAFAAINGLVGTGLLGTYHPLDTDGQLDTSKVLWREVRGPIDAFGGLANANNNPVPTIIPSIEFDNVTKQFATICNGFAVQNSNGDLLGGGQAYGVRWQGMLIVEEKGDYTFYAGEPTEEENKAPIYDENSLQKWEITLERGQKKWELLAKDLGEEHIPCDCSATVCLLPGAYQLTIDYINPAPDFDRKEEVCPQTAGFQLKYKGADTKEEISLLPFHRLYRDCKTTTLDTDVEFLTQNGNNSPSYQPISGNAKEHLACWYTSTIRDIRRTYQRAYKAGVLAKRFALESVPTTKSYSELSYLLNHSADFAGSSYDPSSGADHHVYFDFNLLPVDDTFKARPAIEDARHTPTPLRQQAWFDLWERTFDHKALETANSANTQDQLWELYLYEKDEGNQGQKPEGNRLERYLATNLAYAHTDAILQFAPSLTLSHAELHNEEWAIRVSQAAQAVQLMTAALDPEKDIAGLLPMDWASGTDLESLVTYVCENFLDNCDPPRYADLEALNNKLRQNARRALIAYLTARDRVTLPWEYISGTAVYATEAKHLTELVLLDVEADVCQKASRIEEAISSVQRFIRRVRLGLEYGTSTTAAFAVGLDFAQLWDKKFATYNIWKKCKLRELYGENWLEYDRLEEARQSEAFRFLEDRLRRQTLTVPLVKEIPNPVPHNNVGGVLLQQREPAITQNFGLDATGNPNVRQGFDQLGTPEVHGRPSWLTSITESDLSTSPPKVPYWIEAAMRLGKKFVRIAAAGQPSNRIYCGHEDSACCEQCVEPHTPIVDEYYFWLVDSSFYQAITQNADWNWHSDADLPTLLNWGAEPKVLLAWTKIHNGEFQQLRFSDEGVHVVDGIEPDITLLGRTADTLQFEILGGITPVGYPNTPTPGFRYDLATDSAVVLPQLTNPLDGFSSIGGLPAFPSFVYFAPGASVMPPSLFSPAIVVADNLRAHCRFEVALKTYEQFYNPLQRDNQWGGVTKEDKAILLHHLETLLQWGDALLNQHSPEAFQQAHLVFETACKLLGAKPVAILEDAPSGTPTIGSFTNAQTQQGLNPRLLDLYDNVQDRLDLIRSCQNAKRYVNGTPNKDMPYFGNNPFRHGWLHNEDICVDELESCLPHSPYRFQFLLQKAQEFAGEVTSLGGALLSAYEKGDGEYLASLRAYHEKQLLELALSIRQDQWRAADWDVQGLYKTKEMAQIRLAYNQELYSGGLNGGESDYVSYTHLSLTELIISKAIEIGAQILRGIPDVLAGLPQMHLPLGSKMAGFVSTISQVFSTMSQYHGTYAGLRNTEGGWDRRLREWLHQIELITVEIQQIERQILASERRRDVALKELNNQVQQIENSKEVFDFMKDKFSNHELYLWMQKETAALHHQMYELALLLARQAERAYNRERGHTTKKFIDGNMIWDNLHEGLLAGERLQHSLRRMEKTYYDENVREYELTKQISLRHHFPLEFLMLKETGCCTICLPEWLFDMDYPGHYMRRIKSIALNIPAVVGPYTGVHCRLTLLSSSTRIKPHLNKNVDESCLNKDAINNGYPALPDDPRIVNQFISSQAIATSSGQQDSGMFELNFNDDRYLPFEYAGAVSNWRIELPKENNFFDMDSLGDVIIQMNYMAREGGELLRAAASEVAWESLPGDGKHLIDVIHELPDAWHKFKNCADDQNERALELKLSRQMFPYLPCDKEVALDCLELVLEVSDDFQAEQFQVKFVPDEQNCHTTGKGKTKGLDIACVAASDWKNDCDCTRLFQGKVDLKELGIKLNGSRKRIGQLELPKGVKEIKNFYALFQYAKVEQLASQEG